MNQSNDEISLPKPVAKVLSFADAAKKRALEAQGVFTQQKPVVANAAPASNTSNIETTSSFEEEIRKFAETQKRLNEERLKANKSVLKSYKIKESKDEK